jgi:hypothetical protein
MSRVRWRTERREACPGRGPARITLRVLRRKKKRRSNRQPRAAARGRPRPWFPLPWLAVRGRSTRPPPVPGSTQPSSKRPIDLQWSAATGEGCGGTLPPRCTQAHARTAAGTRVGRLSLGTRRACDRCPPAPRSGGPDLDAGALRQYSAKPSKEGGKTIEGQRQADTHVARKPRAARRVAPGTGRSGAAAYLQERQRSAEPLEGAEGWQEAVARAERSGAGAFRMAPWGAARGGKAQRLFERVAEPTGGRNVAWQPSRLRGQSSGAGVSAAALTGPRAAALTGTQFRPLVREPGVAWTPRRPRLGGVPHGAAVDDGGVGPRPARPNDPAALCRGRSSAEPTARRSGWHRRLRPCARRGSALCMATDPRR